MTWPCPHEKARAVCPDCGATVSAASSVSAWSVKALIADASEPFLVPDVTPRGASKAAVFHVLRDMVDAGALEHHADGYRRPNAAASAGAGDFGIVPDTSKPDPRGMGIRPSAGAGQVPADTIEQAREVKQALSWLVWCIENYRVDGEPLSLSANLDGALKRARAVLAAVRTPEQKT